MSALRGIQRRTPFHSFTIELVSGDRFQVDHPDALVLRDSATMFVAAGGVPTLFNHESVSQIIADANSQRSSA